MNRFLLNLRSIDTQGATSLTPDDFANFTAPNFRVSGTILGNIGQPLDHDLNEELVDDDSGIGTEQTKGGRVNRP